MSGGTPGRVEKASLKDAIDLYRAGLAAEALASIDTVLTQDPESAAAHHARGVILEALGDPTRAAGAYREAIGHEPGIVPAWINLGRLTDAAGDPAEAARCYDRALMIDGGNALALANLGELFHRQGDLSTARALLEAAHTADSDLPDAAFNLGRIRLAEHELDEAQRLFGIAAEKADPTRSSYADAFLLSTLCHPRLDRELLSELHRAWGARYAAGTPAPYQHRMVDRVARPLAIGLLSGDFNAHPASRFLEPVFAHHDRARILIVAYHTLSEEDETTERLRANADRWRSIAGWPVDRVVRQIETDGIDILIDLSGHTQGARFDVLARKPTPLQGEWLGYLHPSGLPTIDFRISDRLMDTVDANDRRSLFLDNGIWCYAPYPDAPAIATDELPEPADAGRSICFGSFNNPMKINQNVLECWAQLLAAEPESTLTLGGFDHDAGRVRVARRLAELAVAPERLNFLPKLPVGEYLSATGKCDVALDPFPYGGGTTTFDCLWMGTPVVTLAGDRACGRGTAAILRRLRLEALIAPDIETYITIARQTARCPAVVTGGRQALRDRLAASPLTDGPAFCRNLENALMFRWRQP